MSRPQSAYSGDGTKPPPIPARQPLLLSNSAALPPRVLVTPHGVPADNNSSASRPNTPVPNRKTKPLPRTKSQGSACTADAVKPLRVNLPRQAVSLRTLSELYSNYLPARVMTNKHFGSLLLPQDMLNVHFVKRRPTMRVAARGGCSYLLPLKTPVKVGFVHDSPSCCSVFETVAELAAASPAPKVVCSRKRWGEEGRGGGDDGNRCAANSGIAVGEVLALLGLIEQGGQRMLRVYSYALKSAKMLPMNCAGSFTLCPNEIKLSLSELLDNAGISFPWSVVLFPDGNASAQYPRELFGDVATVTGCSETVSVVCTRHVSGEDSNDIIELPVDTPLEVNCVCLSEAHVRDLKAHSAEVSQRYDENAVALTADATDIAVSTKAEGSGAARMDHLLCQECLSKTTTSRDKEGSLPRMATGPNVKREGNNGAQHCALEVSVLVQRYDEMLKDVTSLRENLKVIQSQVAGLLNAKRGNCAVLSEADEANRKSLRALSIEQVLEVLEVMKLGQYKETFSEKQIDGIIFAELNESLLEHELEVKSRLHRLKILLVAKGRIWPLSRELTKGQLTIK